MRFIPHVLTGSRWLLYVLIAVHAHHTAAFPAQFSYCWLCRSPRLFCCVYAYPTQFNYSLDSWIPYTLPPPPLLQFPFYPPFWFVGSFPGYITHIYPPFIPVPFPFVVTDVTGYAVLLVICPFRLRYCHPVPRWLVGCPYPLRFFYTFPLFYPGLILLYAVAGSFCCTLIAVGVIHVGIPIPRVCWLLLLLRLPHHLFAITRTAIPPRYHRHGLPSSARHYHGSRRPVRFRARVYVCLRVCCGLPFTQFDCIAFIYRFTQFGSSHPSPVRAL